MTNPRRPFYLFHIPSVGGSQMVQTCPGDELPGGEPGKYYVLRTDGDAGHDVWDVTDPRAPVQIAVLTENLDGTHKNWWECDTGIAYLVADLVPEGWTTGRGLKIFDLSNPASPVFIRNFGMVGSQPGATEPPTRSPEIHEPTRLGDRVYLAYGTSGEGALQILDREALLTDLPADPTNPRRSCWRRRSPGSTCRTPGAAIPPGRWRTSSSRSSSCSSIPRPPRKAARGISSS